MNAAVRAALCRHNAEFHRVERSSGVSAGHLGEKTRRVFPNLRVISPHSPLRVLHGASDQFHDILCLKRVKLEDHRAGQERSVHFKIGIFGSRSDQRQRAVFHEREEIILLGFVKAVDLVDKQDGLLPEHPSPVLRLLDDLLHVLLSGGRGVDLPEPRFCRICDHLGKSCLAGSGRSVEDQAADLVRLDRPVQELVFSDDVLLPYHFFKRGRAQARGQRRLRLLFALSHIVKKIHKSSLLSFLGICLE